LFKLLTRRLFVRADRTPSTAFQFEFILFEEYMRQGKELILATKPYAQEQRYKSWWCLFSTMIVLGLLIAVACVSSYWFVYIPCSIFAGLLLVRLFVIYHDYMHGAILRKSVAAKIIMHIYGLIALSPPSVWKHSHDDHHKHNSRSFGNALGSFPLMTTVEFARASFWQRLTYRISRHPLTIACGYLTAFFWNMSLRNFLDNPRKHYTAGLAITAHLGLAVGLAMISIQSVFWGMIVPMSIAGALGSYLFYAQHNFPEMERRTGEEWDYVLAAQRSSSFMRMGKLMNWFTGNIGFHHVHHLNAKIPFYRLHEAMAGIAELQSNVGTSLHPVEIIRCLRLNLWDQKTGKMVSFRAAKICLAQS
jgi:omega-6 fatty acid desaturase (delta-12 desaturase)